MIEPIRLVPVGPEIRELTSEEIQSLAADFDPYGLPDPKTSTAIGIVDGGKIVAYQFLQLKLHVQPTKITEGYSHMFSALCRKSEEIILQKCGPTWVYLFCTPGRMAALAETRGMAVEPWVVMSKAVVPPAPGRPLVEFPLADEMPIVPEDLTDMPAEGGTQ